MRLEQASEFSSPISGAYRPIKPGPALTELCTCMIDDDVHTQNLAMLRGGNIRRGTGVY
jgi:hypothetical protein